MFNVSVLVTTTDEDHRIIEKYLIIYIKDKRDFNLTLSNNKVGKRKIKIFIGKFRLFRRWKIRIKIHRLEILYSKMELEIITLHLLIMPMDDSN
jgi:hypothetical protein